MDGLKVIGKIFWKHFYNYVLIRQGWHLERGISIQFYKKAMSQVYLHSLLQFLEQNVTLDKLLILVDTEPWFLHLYKWITVIFMSCVCCVCE